ncbi:MAG TPA: hypothetical protein VKI65_14680 [Gemmataceae bacterium]|nr:hypothetical protein [Gemmataceae bacterium]
MSCKATSLSFALIAAIGLAGCNGTDQKTDDRSDRQPATAAENGKPALQPARDQPPAEQPSNVTLLRVPNGGIQPQAVVDAKGTLHLIYFKGEAGGGDLFYVRRQPGQERFSAPIRVNSQLDSAIATGTIRGGQIALGKAGRVHIAWNGSGKDKRAEGMLYARLNDSGTAFEEQRNLMRDTEILDGGGSVAADASGNVYVVWHALKKGSERGEEHRQVWVARSADEGKSFAKEAPAWTEATGACGCCGLRAFADSNGSVYVLYRSAKAEVNRDVYLLASKKGTSFEGALVHKWKVPG